MGQDVRCTISRRLGTGFFNGEVFTTGPDGTYSSTTMDLVFATGRESTTGFCSTTGREGTVK